MVRFLIGVCLSISAQLSAMVDIPYEALNDCDSCEESVIKEKHQALYSDVIKIKSKDNDIFKCPRAFFAKHQDSLSKVMQEKIKGKEITLNYSREVVDAILSLMGLAYFAEKDTDYSRVFKKANVDYYAVAHFFITRAPGLEKIVFGPNQKINVIKLSDLHGENYFCDASNLGIEQTKEINLPRSTLAQDVILSFFSSDLNTVDLDYKTVSIVGKFLKKHTSEEVKNILMKRISINNVEELIFGTTKKK